MAIVALLAVPLLIVPKRHTTHDALGTLLGDDSLDHLLDLLSPSPASDDTDDAILRPWWGCGWDLDSTPRRVLHLLDDTAPASNDHSDIPVRTLKIYRVLSKLSGCFFSTRAKQSGQSTPKKKHGKRRERLDEKQCHDTPSFPAPFNPMRLPAR
mmetsp:Transcript_32830/g.74982  ORF Transcript_32830/g.74982 Transcript_32830/m.74982 type:complete len:154 (-) Transcript_32830:1498-1959(-)